MKRLLSCLTACAVFLFGALPCYAMPSLTPPHLVASMDELLAWYGGLSGNALQECIVTNPIKSTGEITLGSTPCRVNITFVGGLHIPASARLIVDNPSLVLMGSPPAITVEPDGILHIRRWNALVAQALPPGGIVVQAGGALLTEAGITIPGGVVIDDNPPPNTLPPPIPETPDQTPNPELPNETAPTEETLSITGEVLKVSAQSVLLAMVTLPRVDPTHIKTIIIERSADTQEWKTEYIFRWDEDALSFTSNETSEFGKMMSKTRNDGIKTDFKYLARLSGSPFYLRVSTTKADGSKVVSDAIQLTEPPVGQYPGSEDYEDSGGNRGGGGQGITDREEQKETATSRPGKIESSSPQSTPHTYDTTESISELPIFTTTPQKVSFAYQSAAQSTEQTALPEQEIITEQSGQAVSMQNKPLSSFMRNWLIFTVTLVLSSVIWIFTIKRKKA